MRVRASIVAALTAVALVGTVGTASATPAKKVAAKASEGCGQSTVAAGEEKVTTSSGGAERWYYRHVPPAHDGKTPLPIVVDLHGYVEGAQVHRTMSGLGAYGDEQGFITITPQGSGTKVALWDLERGSPDVRFIGDLLDEAESQLCVDRRRVYVTGLSFGAFMTSRLACSLADRFAAAAPVAGIRDPKGCKPSRAVPVVAFHGTADQFVAFNGGIGPAAANLPLPDGSGTIGDAAVAELANGPSVPKLTAAWANRNDCASKPVEKAVASDVKLVSYKCPRGADVQLYEIEGGGHTWPGSEFSRAIEKVVGKTTFSINADEVMWDFFRKHPLRA